MTADDGRFGEARLSSISTKDIKRVIRLYLAIP
jgi:hypothetical protein